MWASSSTSASCGLRPEDRVDVHLGQAAALIVDLLARHDRYALDQRLSLGAAVRFDDADHTSTFAFFRPAPSVSIS